MKKLGIRFKPPTLILIYSFDSNKLHKREMPIRNFRADSNVRFTASDLRLRHKQLDCISQAAVERMLRLLQENMKGVSLEVAICKVNKEYKIALNDYHATKSEEVQQNVRAPLTEETNSHSQEEEGQIESGWDISQSAVADTDDFWG